MKDIKKYAYFSGTVIYKKEITLTDKLPDMINLGIIHGVSELFVNGKSCGVKWYGDRIHSVKGLLKEGTKPVLYYLIKQISTSIFQNFLIKIYLKM